MHAEFADYLRSKARDCMMLARASECNPTTNKLRILANELIAKAAEYDARPEVELVHLD